MEKEVTSDARWKSYWDSLMEQSKSPVPWGTIVEEKPKHGDLTVEEDTAKHRKSRFKKKTTNRFKKEEPK